jgi:hypothetical protein
MTGITLMYDNQQLLLYCVLKLRLFLTENDMSRLFRHTTDIVHKPAVVSTAVSLKAA